MHAPRFHRQTPPKRFFTEGKLVMDLNRQITQLREARGDAFAEMEALHQTATGEGRDLNDAENKRFNDLQAEVRRLDAAQARVTALLDNGGHPRPTHVGDGGDPGEAREHAELIRRCRLIDAIRVQLDDQSVDAGPLREYQAVVQRRDSGRQIRGMVVPVLERRAILASGSGGSLIEETLRDDQFITPLRDRTVTGRAGATILPDCVGDQLIPRQTGVVSTGWRGEGSDLPDSDPAFDQLELRPKHVGAVSEWSRNMLLQGSPAVDRLLTDDLVAQIG
ncbi:MAG: phage major capsid protein, partial [Pseudomonadota bacterium]